MKVVADENIPFLKGVLDPFCDVVYCKGNEFYPSDVCDADALLIRTRTKCDAALLEGSKVKFIATATIGYDHIDLGYCKSKGIKVVTAAGCNAMGVKQYIAAVLHEIKRRGFINKDTVLGIVGVGNVGSQIANLAEQLGIKVLCCDPLLNKIGFVALDELLEKSNIISLHVPLTMAGEFKTSDMASDSFFEKMQNGAIFINTSRGEVVNEQALAKDIKSGKIKFAAIDVWRDEPSISQHLLEIADIVTPHIAGYSLQGKANGTAIIVNALCREFNLPIADWYPEGVAKVDHTVDISWQMLDVNMKAHFDINKETEALKADPLKFEQFRNDYKYREEFF